MNNYEHDDLCVGIDLGTTNSVLSTITVKPNGEIVSKVVDVFRTKEICNDISGGGKLGMGKEHTLPSCVYYREERNYEPLVGDFAKRQYSLRPHLVAKSIKSQMGNARVEGLAGEVPDKTPAEVSARILEHLLNETAKIYHRKKITDAVITVPANFDSVMCEATLQAAKLAGIQVTEADGSMRRVLLPEPDAVIYDFVNQSQNGEISGDILDLSTKKNVMVFDLGGGTLDITMHEIERKGPGNGVIHINPLATNRYTLLGGDDFDEAIAEAMYERYLKCREYPAAVMAKLTKEKDIIMAQLRVFAENMKFELNERCGNAYAYSGWDDEEEEITFDVGGSMKGIGYSYYDTFTKEEVENILKPFLAEEISFSDYKKLSAIKGTRNIIYPILDVLDKTLQKMKSEDDTVEDVKVDAVIVNGGMSKFYMITERLSRFFGFDPIVVLDPDLAVARGAAVYHHYLHKGQVPTAIRLESSILNDSLYLGVKNDGVHQIIPTGAKLPYASEIMTGFSIEPGQNMISIPIKSRNLDGSYRTIASGRISFSMKYPAGAYVAFQILMGSNKVITMKAWTSKDISGMEKLEEGSVMLVAGQNDCGKKARISAPCGSALNPANELHNLLSLCNNHDRTKDANEKRELAKRISHRVRLICNAGNKEEFAEPVLEELGRTSCEEAKHRLFTIARMLGQSWSEKSRNRLADRCILQISGELNGWKAFGPKVSTNIEAIMALSICGKPVHIKHLEKIREDSRYHQSCLYVHGRTGNDLEWLFSELKKDVKLVQTKSANSLQFSSHAMGHALKKSNSLVDNVSLCEKVVECLVNCIKSGGLSNETVLGIVVAVVGMICDQRKSLSLMKASLLQDASEVVSNLGMYYEVFMAMKCSRAATVAHKLIQGTGLDEEEEEFLLTKLDLTA